MVLIKLNTATPVCLTRGRSTQLLTGRGLPRVAEENAQSPRRGLFPTERSGYSLALARAFKTRMEDGLE